MGAHVGVIHAGHTDQVAVKITDQRQWYLVRAQTLFYFSVGRFEGPALHKVSPFPIGSNRLPWKSPLGHRKDSVYRF